MQSKFGVFTDEQRAINIAKAHQARKDKAAFREANKHLLKTSYLDSNYWASLASKHSIRMPSNEDKATASVINKYLKLTGVPMEAFKERYTSSSYFLKNNPLWTSYSVAGLILEIKEELTMPF